MGKIKEDRTSASPKASHNFAHRLASADLDVGSDNPVPGSVVDDSTADEVKFNKNRLVAAFQTRIQVPIYGIGTLRLYLEDANWDQQTAYDAFMADFHALHTAPTATTGLATTPVASRGLPDNIREVQVVIHGNQEEQRREAMRLLRAIVNFDRDPNNRVNLTLTEAFFALVLTGWDVEAAVLRWASPDVIRWQIHHTFDHLRASTADQVGIDERTTKFSHFTGRDDWHSIRDFLAAHNQQFTNAVRAWYRNGMPVTWTPGWNEAGRLFEGRRVTQEGLPRSPMPSGSDTMPMVVNGDDWAPDETTFRLAGQPPSHPLAQPLQDLRRTTSKRTQGFCFTPEGDAPPTGGIMPQYFTVDYLQNGKYVANGFDWKTWYRPELPESDFNRSTNRIFDQHNPDHVVVLGKWIRQQHSRVEGSMKRASPQTFSGKEKRFLFELCKRHVEKMVTDNPGKTAADFRPPIFRDAATRQLEKDFNEAFEGKILSGDSEPRRHRMGTALKVKCARMKKFRTAFGFKLAGKAGEGAGSDSPEWSDDDARLQPPSVQAPKPRLGIPLMRTAAEQLAATVRQANLDEEASNDTINADADTLLERIRANIEQTLKDDEPIDARIQDFLRTGLTNEENAANVRAVVRHSMRRSSMAIPGEAAADHQPIPAPDSEAPRAILSDRQLALQRQQDNLAEESSIADIDARAAVHRRYVRGRANQYYSDSGSLFPPEPEVANRVRLALHAELREGKISAQHAAVVRHLMRSLGMVPSEEANAMDDAEDEEMEVGNEAAEDGEGETEEDDEAPDLEELDFTDCFPNDLMGLDDE